MAFGVEDVLNFLSKIPSKNRLKMNFQFKGKAATDVLPKLENPTLDVAMKAKSNYQIAALNLKDGNKSVANIAGSRISNSAMEFKAKGNYFVKGKAVLKNGERYTGEIVNTLKDGGKVVCTYENGLLKKAVKTDPYGTVKFKKEYDYIYREASREPRHFTERQLKSVKEDGYTFLEKTEVTDNIFSQSKKIVLDNGYKRIHIKRDWDGKPMQVVNVENVVPSEQDIQVFTKNTDGTWQKNSFTRFKGDPFFDAL